MVTVEDLVKAFPPGRGERRGRVLAVDGVSIAVEDGQLFTLLGPSGCGKTTTLRCIAGLETPDTGEICIADRVLFSSSRRTRVPANQRGLGMVFQSYAIWPQMNVFDDVAFPLEVLPRRRRPRRAEIRERVERALAVVKLAELAARAATDLSGGRQQRLALARALVMEPPVLLLDEPLSNLDAKLREDMRFELKRLQRELGVTCIYVTHDQTEALAMSNSVAVMRNGRIEQTGTPREIYEGPKSQSRTSSARRTSSTASSRPSTAGRSRCAPRRACCASGRPTSASPSATRSPWAARPEHLGIEVASSPNGAVPNRWVGRVTTRAFLGEAVDHVVAVGDAEQRVRCNSTVSIPPETQVAEDRFGIRTHRFFMPSYSAEDLLASREAIAHWSRMSYGHMGRTPDYKASFMATLGADPDWYAPFQESGRRWWCSSRRWTRRARSSSAGARTSSTRARRGRTRCRRASTRTTRS